MRILITIMFLFTTATIYGQGVTRHKKPYKPFAGHINVIDSGAVQYNGDVLLIKGISPEYFYLFQHGILHSGLFGGGKGNSQKINLDTLSANQKAFYAFIRTDTLTISNITAQSLKDNSKKVKRFTFWLFKKGLANPIEYHFELTNPNGTNSTNSATFIQGSKLTLFEQGSIII